jgi:hypothetical protein
VAIAGQRWPVPAAVVAGGHGAAVEGAAGVAAVGLGVQRPRLITPLATTSTSSAALEARQRRRRRPRPTSAAGSGLRA